jgi:hypothetical protein
MVAVACLASGCVTSQILADESSGQVGCPPDEITISDKRDGAFNLVWKAQCRGRTYFCTFGDPTSCKEEAGSSGAPTEPPPEGAPADAPAAGGCQYDTQCKGDRICEQGRCVDSKVTTPMEPAPAPTPAPGPAPAPR